MRNPRERAGGIRVGRFAGVELIADWSLLVIVALIAVSLGAGLFPSWHPTWSPALIWGTAIAAALAFIASIAMHEMSHALVGRRHDVPIRRITLFVFGGMAHMDRPPSSPKAEFWMAIVGPIVSITFGLVATLAGVVLAGDAALMEQDDAAAIAANIGPVATLLLWLGPINVVLGVFNLVPGFPLDGGRVLRAVLWWASGDLRRATRWAAGAGQAFGWFLMALGIGMAFGLFVPVLGGGLVQGLWLVLIGWFLSNAARASYQQVLVRQALSDVPVADIMQSHVAAVSPDMSVASLVRDYFMASEHISLPVVRGTQLLGMVHIADLRGTERSEWDEMTVADIMTPVERLDTVTPDDGALEAMQRLAEHEQIPVVEAGQLLGVTRRQDLMKWVAMRQSEWS